MRNVSTAVILLALAACADNEAGVTAGKAPTQAGSASDAQVAQQTCSREPRIGSSIPVTNCTPSDNGRSFQQMRDDLPKTGGVPVTAQQFGR